MLPKVNLFGPLAKVYVCEMQKFYEFFTSRKFLLAKVLPQKMRYSSFSTQNAHIAQLSETCILYFH